ncbi:MAG: RHS repeat-associated core domain-containing protein [Spirochaetes bacterium]|nr:RHS repeat-associated core domain-containing protein [Spirochaetota bacterium]
MKDNCGTVSEKNTMYFHPDHLGSSSYVTDKKGNFFEMIEYLPYGETLYDEAATVDKTEFRFTGHLKDDETGFYYCHARYYDPKIGKFLSTDPILEQYLPMTPIGDKEKEYNKKLPGMGGVFNSVNLNMYHYAGNNPINMIDPDGCSEIAVAGYSNNGNHRDDRTAALRAWKVQFLSHKSKLGSFVLLEISTGKSFLDKLSKYSNTDNPITRLTIFSHGYGKGVILSEAEGIYTTRRDTNAGGINLDELAKKIESGEIVFAKNSEIVLAGCNLGREKFAQKLADITGAKVIAADGAVEQICENGFETGEFKAENTWIEFNKDRSPVEIGTVYKITTSSKDYK